MNLNDFIINNIGVQFHRIKELTDEDEVESQPKNDEDEFESAVFKSCASSK